MANINGGINNNPAACLRSRLFQQRMAATEFAAQDIAQTMPDTAAQVPTYTTTQRQALSPLAGWHVFDTTAQLPLWYDGTNWVDATGTIVP